MHIIMIISVCILALLIYHYVTNVTTKVIPTTYCYTKNVSLTSLDMGALTVVPREGTLLAELFWYVIRGSELWWFREDRPYLDVFGWCIACMPPPCPPIAAAVLELTPPRAPALGIPAPEGTQPPMLLPRILFKLGIDRPMRSEKYNRKWKNTFKIQKNTICKGWWSLKSTLAWCRLWI